MIIWERGSGRKCREISVRPFNLPASHLCFSPNGKRLYGSFWNRQDMILSAWDVATGAKATDLPFLPNQDKFVNFSPDGREAILLHKQTDIVRWDLDTGKELGRYPKPPGKVKTGNAVGDRLLVPVIDDQGFAMWDASQKKQLWSMKGPYSQLSSFPGRGPTAFAADGKSFAIEGTAGVIPVYESLTGKVVRRLEGKYS